MNFRSAVAGLIAFPAMACAQLSSVDLPEFTVHSPRVANQDPVATFAMPVSALRFEPRVDVEARNLAEGQADVTIRGGIFENTGFKIGAVSLYDPQTGHYFAEIPIAPAMLGAPEVRTGADNALLGWNANAGTVAYGWRPIRTGGAASARIGDFDTSSEELYQGYRSDLMVGDQHVSADAAVSHSRSHGSQPFGEHDFTRYNARVQLAGGTTQTDFFYGYQSKDFGWPNLYTPFAHVFETEALQTNLLAFNHRSDLGGGDYASIGAYYRRNKDHYVFNRPDPGAFNPAFGVSPSFHTTWVSGIGIEGRFSEDEMHYVYAGTFVHDDLKSTSLVYGRYHTRGQVKFSFAPERSWTLADGKIFTAEAGAAYDDTNRDGSAVSPLAQLSLDHLAPEWGLERAYVSYAKSTQTPTYTALNSNPKAGLFRGNPDLAREVTHNLELGAEGAWGRWRATAAVFWRRDDHLVDWTYSAAATNARTAHAVDIDTTGFETVVRYSTPRAELIFGYTALTKNADYGTATVDASFYALNFPRQRLTAAATLRLGGGWELRLDNEARIQEPNALRRSDRKALLSSAGVYFSPAFVHGLTLSAEVENLWNSSFEEVPAVPAAKRQFDVGATYAW